MKKGFTLIELLVVIAIMGMLAGIVFASLNSSREKALIAKAALDVKQIMIAAALVYDTYGYYPNDSHSEVICPQDIVIDSVSGKKWGEYLKVCNDPWGKPYEWNNRCLLSDGSYVKRSDHDPQSGCAAFSDSQGGPIGVAVNRDDVLETADLCTGSNLCFGERGHEVRNWGSAVNVIVTPPPAKMCKAGLEPLTCSDLSPLQCSTRTGCLVSGTSCVGTISNSCSSFNQTQCTQTGGCAWASGGSCGGSVSCSLYSESQTSCQSNGCSYSAGLCGGSALSCSTWNNNQSSCSSQIGCSYNNSTKKCNGTHQICSSYSSTQCGTQLGCSYAAASCSGSPSCGAFNSSQCSSTSGCSWTDSSSCQGSYGSNCSIYNSNQNSCQASAECTWVGAVCTGSAASCGTFNSENSCSAETGCVWE